MQHNFTICLRTYAAYSDEILTFPTFAHSPNSPSPNSENSYSLWISLYLIFYSTLFSLQHSPSSHIHILLKHFHFFAPPSFPNDSFLPSAIFVSPSSSPQMPVFSPTYLALIRPCSFPSPTLLIPLLPPPPPFRSLGRRSIFLLLISRAQLLFSFDFLTSIIFIEHFRRIDARHQILLSQGFVSLIVQYFPSAGLRIGIARWHRGTRPYMLYLS